MRSAIVRGRDSTAQTLLNGNNRGLTQLFHSCSSNVADVLGMVGIVAYDPRWLAFDAVSPEDIDVGLQHSKCVKEKRLYPKDGS